MSKAVFEVCVKLAGARARGEQNGTSPAALRLEVGTPNRGVSRGSLGVHHPPLECHVARHSSSLLQCLLVLIASSVPSSGSLGPPRVNWVALRLRYMIAKQAKERCVSGD